MRDGVAIDLTELRMAEETARWRLEHDALTGLPTRSVFLDRLEQALLHARVHDTAVGVCFVDVDKFKLINDALGHASGDEVLRAIAERIRDCLRVEDTLARHGGDELTVLFPDLPSREFAVVLAERIAAACHTPVSVGGRDVSFTCSVGVAVAPDDGIDAQQLLRRADAAKYRAKEHGRARVELFNPELARQNEERSWLEQRLRAAIERGRARTRLPASGGHAGATHERRGAAPLAAGRVRGDPAERVRPARGGHGPDRRDRRLGPAPRVRDGSGLGEGGEPLRVCVNLSPCQLADAGIDRFVAATLAETGLSASLLELELTETALMEQGESVIAPLRELRKLGVRISLDDFGTGYSSLARLRHLPLDALKIDASFVAEIGEGQGTAIVGTIIELGHTLGLDVIGEGVETVEQQQMLEALGCDRIQGYLIGIPMSEVSAAPWGSNAAV